MEDRTTTRSRAGEREPHGGHLLLILSISLCVTGNK